MNSHIYTKDHTTILSTHTNTHAIIQLIVTCLEKQQIDAYGEITFSAPIKYDNLWLLGSMTGCLDEKWSCPERLSGWLYILTNQSSGYQKRWFVISNGMLSYYRLVWRSRPFYAAPSRRIKGSATPD